MLCLPWEDTAICKPRRKLSPRTESASTLVLDFRTPDGCSSAPPMGSLFQQPQLTETLPERFQYPSKPTRERSAHWEEFVDVDLCWTGKYSSLSEVKKELPVRLSTATHSAWLLHVFLWPGLLQSVTSRGNKGKITLGVT